VSPNGPRPLLLLSMSKKLTPLGPPDIDRSLLSGPSFERILRRWPSFVDHLYPLSCLVKGPWATRPSRNSRGGRPGVFRPLAAWLNLLLCGPFKTRACFLGLFPPAHCSLFVLPLSQKDPMGYEQGRLVVRFFRCQFNLTGEVRDFVSRRRRFFRPFFQFGRVAHEALSPPQKLLPLPPIPFERSFKSLLLFHMPRPSPCRDHGKLPF